MKIDSLKSFLDNSPSAYHAVAALEEKLAEAGYTCLRQSENWELTPGGKYYVNQGGSALFAFRIPEGEPAGFMMSAAHCDRPAFKLKENGELWLVIRKQQGAESCVKYLKTLFYEVEKLDKSAGFWVLKAYEPKKDTEGESDEV